MNDCDKNINEKFDKNIGKEDKEKVGGDINAMCSC